MSDTKMNTANDAFAALQEALKSTRIAFRLDLRVLCHPHCPLPLDHYKTRIAYAYLGLMVFLYAGVTVLDLSRWPFWSTLVVFTLIYWIGVRPVAERRVRKQIVGYIMD